MPTLFPSRLSSLRSQAGLTQAQLALYLHLNRSTISNYEKGARMPEAETLCRLVHLFGVSADYLLGLSDRKGIFEENASAMREQINRLFLNDQACLQQAVRECLNTASESRKQLRAELIRIVQNETLSEQQRDAFFLFRFESESGGESL